MDRGDPYGKGENGENRGLELLSSLSDTFSLDNKLFKTLAGKMHSTAAAEITAPVSAELNRLLWPRSKPV